VGFGRKRTATGRAQIIEARALPGTSGLEFGAQSRVGIGVGRDAGPQVNLEVDSVHLRVAPDDGGPEFESKARIFGGRTFSVGDSTYVLYDPAHPDHCKIDYDRLSKESGEKKRVTIPRPGAKPDLESVFKAKVAQYAQPPAGNPAPAASLAGGGDPESIEQRLAKLQKLRDDGVLTPEEFAAQRQRIIDAL
jgi:hypothetical protein